GEWILGLRTQDCLMWKATDQTERLAELLREERELKEAPLRRDVRSLGRLLGETIKEQAGLALFESVEQLRLLAIRNRDLNEPSANGAWHYGTVKPPDAEPAKPREQDLPAGLSDDDPGRDPEARRVPDELTQDRLIQHAKDIVGR